MTPTSELSVGWGWTYLNQRTGRVLHLHQPVSFLLELVHLLLMQQQVVVLEELIQIRGVVSARGRSQRSKLGAD